MLRLAVSNIRREGDYEVGLCVTFYVLTNLDQRYFY